MTEYDHQQTAQREVLDYRAYYNHERTRPALGYLSPRRFELTTHLAN